MTNIQALQEKIIDIAESPIAPHGEFYMGMNFREYLIGQALSNLASQNSTYAHLCALSAIAHADEVIKALAEEALEKEVKNDQGLR